MRRVRVGIVGAGSLTEGAILPALSGADMMAPPDNGSWWQRQSGGHADIDYQAPVRPEVVALSDAREERAKRIGQSARIHATYSDWRVMLRETPLDVLICALPPDECAKVLWDVHARALPSPLWMWLPGPPAPTSAAASDLAASTMSLRVWCARPWRQAAAHRAARRLIERGEIEAVTALSLRWPASVFRGDNLPAVHARGGGKTDGAALSSSYAALDLLMSFASLCADRARPSSAQAVVNAVAAREYKGATNVWMGFESGPTATALFSAAEDWNAPWPRLEICGSHGKSIVCEGGRNLQLFEPREPSRVLSPPSTPTVSAANLLGVAEDLKGFFAAWQESRDGTRAAPKYFPDLAGAARVLEVVETISAALQTDTLAAQSATMPSMAPKTNGRGPVLPRLVDSTPAATRSDEAAGAGQNAVLPLYD